MAGNELQRRQWYRQYTIRDSIIWNTANMTDTNIFGIGNINAYMYCEYNNNVILSEYKDINIYQERTLTPFITPEYITDIYDVWVTKYMITNLCGKDASKYLRIYVEICLNYAIYLDFVYTQYGIDYLSGIGWIAGLNNCNIFIEYRWNYSDCEYEITKMVVIDGDRIHKKYTIFIENRKLKKFDWIEYQKYNAIQNNGVPNNFDTKHVRFGMDNKKCVPIKGFPNITIDSELLISKVYNTKKLIGFVDQRIGVYALIYISMYSNTIAVPIIYNNNNWIIDRNNVEILNQNVLQKCAINILLSNKNYKNIFTLNHSENKCTSKTISNKYISNKIFRIILQHFEDNTKTNNNSNDINSIVINHDIILKWITKNMNYLQY